MICLNLIIFQNDLSLNKGEDSARQCRLCAQDWFIKGASETFVFNLLCCNPRRHKHDQPTKMKRNRQQATSQTPLYRIYLEGL